MENNNTENKNKVILWLKRVGLAGFLFFLIKGLIWLALIFFGGKAIFE
jgi:hypothetical protein